MAVQPLGNGVTLCLKDAGTGMPVVFLHGAMMSRQFFRHQIMYFSSHYRAVAPDFRGHVDSDKVLSGHTVSIYAQDLRRFFEFFSKIHVPTMVVFRGDDKLTSPKAGEFIASRIPNAKLRIFGRSRHCPFYEEPELFNRVLHEFVSSLAK